MPGGSFNSGDKLGFVNTTKADVTDSVLIVVDVQPSFMRDIWERDRVLARAEFLIRVANLLEVPVLTTEQYPQRMGGTDERLRGQLSDAVFPKMTFSCCGCDDFVDSLKGAGRKQAILIGIETHICVSQTAVDLLSQGYDVLVCPDAVSARSVEMHKLGMERMRDAGVLPIHTEAVAYEWMGTAEHEKFRDALKIVKAFA